MKLLDFVKGLFWGSLFAVAMSAFLVWSVVNMGDPDQVAVDMT